MTKDYTRPEDCNTMYEVRFGVDKLDEKLVKILAERQRYMTAAARIKNNRDDVRDIPRIEDVINKVLAEAKVQGLSCEIAETVWRHLIEVSILYEFQQWDAINSTNTD